MKFDFPETSLGPVVRRLLCVARSLDARPTPSHTGTTPHPAQGLTVCINHVLPNNGCTYIPPSEGAGPPSGLPPKGITPQNSLPPEHVRSRAKNNQQTNN